jgi:hypothetical protein
MRSRAELIGIGIRWHGHLVVLDVELANQAG